MNRFSFVYDTYITEGWFLKVIIEPKREEIFNATSVKKMAVFKRMNMSYIILRIRLPVMITFLSTDGCNYTIEYCIRNILWPSKCDLPIF